MVNNRNIKKRGGINTDANSIHRSPVYLYNVISKLHNIAYPNKPVILFFLLFFATTLCHSSVHSVYHVKGSVFLHLPCIETILKQITMLLVSQTGTLFRLLDWALSYA